MMKKYAVIGYPLSHSSSPQIHNSAFSHLNLDARYEKLEIAPNVFSERIAQLKANREWGGFNITIPFKQQIIPFLDDLDRTARAVGAVNTVQITGQGKWIGHNTDVAGFVKPLQQSGFSPETCLLIGAGGAARAILYALLTFFSAEKIVICNRTVSKAHKLQQDFSAVTQSAIEVVDLNKISAYKKGFDLIVNSTSVGMGALKDWQPVELKGLVKENTLVYDLIYNPAQTRLLKQAAELGARILNGWPMLIFQAAESFRIWTGTNFPEPILNRLLQQRAS